MPSLKAIKTKEPSVMMAALNVFRQVGEAADTDFLALEVLPILWSFSLGPLLDLQQFGAFMTLIKKLSAKIEREQTRKLQELSSGGDSGGFQNGTGSPFTTALDVGQSTTDSTRDNFERLVLGKGSTASTTSNNEDLMNPWSNVSRELPAAQASNQGTLSGFAWSSNATISAGGSANLDRMQSPPIQAKPGFRTVTPDYSLSSFPPLEPTNRQKSPATPTFPVLQPAPPGGAHNVKGSMAGSSLAALASMNTSNTAASRQPQQQGPSFSAFSIPPPPSTSSPLGSYGKPGGVPNTNQSSLGMGMTSPFLNSAPSQAEGTQKQGLDKYESLI